MSAYRGRTIRRSFTLTELLVVIMVISILASSMLFAMYTAVEQAKESRTRAQIAKLHELLVSRWDSYRTRAIRFRVEATSVDIERRAREWLRRNPRDTAVLRLTLLRDLIRMEMPDRAADVTDFPLKIPYNFTDNSGGPNNVLLYMPQPALSRQYQRIAAASTWLNPDKINHQDAECLYLIIAAMRDLNANGLDFLHAGEIGDTDDDGMPEILDAWGNPIAFIRWPAGFVVYPGKDQQWGIAGVDDDGNTAVDDFAEAGWFDSDDIPNYSNLQRIQLDPSDPTRVASEVRDPFDPMRVDSRPSVDMFNASDAQYYFNYFMYPLVFSAGADQLLDVVRFDFDPNDPSTLVAFNFYRTGTNPHGGWMNDPYSVLPTSKRRLGEPFIDSEGYKDNITNHNLGD